MTGVATTASSSEGGPHMPSSAIAERGSHSVDSSRPSRPPAVDLRLLFGAYLRSLPVALVVGAIVGIIVAFSYSRATPVYSVETTVTVGTAARAERDAVAMDAVAAGMSEFVTDERAKEIIEDRSGEPVVLAGRRPTVEVSTATVPGLLKVVTRSESGSDAAARMGTAVVEAMNTRAGELREQFLAPVVDSADEEIADLEDQIAARRQSDRNADTSDLARLIQEARSRTDTLRATYPTANVIGQDVGSGNPSWPTPLRSGAVAGIVVTLAAAAVLGAVRLRRGRRTDKTWAQSVGHRYGSVVDVDAAPPTGLPALTEAAVSAVLSSGGSAVLLGDVDPIVPPPDDRSEEHRLLVASHGEPWWREVAASAVDLGVVVVDHGSRNGRAAEKALAALVEVGVPTRVVVRKSEAAG
ncbi:hypothetical protein [Dietzia sp. Alg238-R159]|uniref:hypothetical protein n=1 Tax=Dietzia sp. Alg238-R159 TaxID=2305986 RepID=UPI0013D375AC|nr:hypothetical protein [Dietzia sp. Alg238-R159]